MPAPDALNVPLPLPSGTAVWTACDVTHPETSSSREQETRRFTIVTCYDRSVGRSSALYRDPARDLAPRAEVSLAWSELTLVFRDGRSRWIDLDGCASDVVDATFRRRFVRMLTIERGVDGLALITP